MDLGPTQGASTGISQHCSIVPASRREPRLTIVSGDCSPAGDSSLGSVLFNKYLLSAFTRLGTLLGRLGG